VCPLVSEYVRATHAAQGVEMLFHAAALSVTEATVETSRGAVEADLVVVGIGVVPETELAAAAGLPVGNGITVDSLLRTSDARVFAIGDCAEFPCVYTDSLVRLESVQNCVDQAIALAKTITGKPAPYTAVPWFWTDQFDIRLQMAGLAPTWDQLVTRGDPGARKFSVFYFRGGALKAVDSINRPADHLAARRLIAGRRPITPAQAADEAFDLKAALS
jgi:3-phenylpropionate/trans-cinnamate dioxygenase ferredoxin reductase subunit